MCELKDESINSTRVGKCVNIGDVMQLWVHIVHFIFYHMVLEVTLLCVNSHGF